MSWVRVDDKAWSHPKFTGLSGNAVRLWLFAVCWANEHETDGMIPRTTLRLLRGRERDAAELVSARLWEENPDGWTIHDYLEYQPSRADKSAKRAATAERVKRHRTRDVTPLHPENQRVSNTAPDPDPIPTRPDPVEEGSGSGGRSVPRNLDAALHVPVRERARLLLEEPHHTDWLQPHKWPELVSLAQEWSAALHWHEPRLSARHPAIPRLLDLLASYTTNELKAALRVAQGDPWLNDPQKKLGLSSLSLEVVGRLLNSTCSNPDDPDAKRRAKIAREAEETFERKLEFDCEKKRKQGWSEDRLTAFKEHHRERRREMIAAEQLAS